MATFFAKSNGGCLFTTSRAAQIELEKLPRGTLLKVDVSQPRNGKQHRLFWAFCALVAECINDGPVGGTWDAERVATLLKLATGHVETVKLSRKDAARLGVEFAALPKSISFAKMDGEAFSKFMDAGFIYVRDELCGWINESPAWPEIGTILRESHLIGEVA